MILLDYTDNGDGTGGVLSIGGSPVGSTNTVLGVKHAGGLGSSPYSAIGTRVGDGTVALSLDSGPYQAFVVNDNAGAVTYSVPISFRVFDQELAIQEQCARAIRDFILGLSLAGVPADPESHVVTKVGAKLEQVLQVADARQAVYYIPVTEDYKVGDSSHNHIRFPTIVSLVTESAQRLVKGASDIYLFRERVQGSLSKCELNVPLVHSIEMRPGAVIDPSKWLDGYDTSNLTIVCQLERFAGVQ